MERELYMLMYLLGSNIILVICLGVALVRAKVSGRGTGIHIVGCVLQLLSVSGGIKADLYYYGALSESTIWGIVAYLVLAVGGFFLVKKLEWL